MGKIIPENGNAVKIFGRHFVGTGWVIQPWVSAVELSQNQLEPLAQIKSQCCATVRGGL